MVEFVKGRLVRAAGGVVVVEAGGLGLRLRVHDEKRFLRFVGRRVSLPAWLAFSPRRLELYGFADAGERDRFTALLGIPGVGAATALKLLPAWDALVAAKGAEVPDLPGIGPAKRARIARWLARREGGKRGPAGHPSPEARDIAGALVGLGIAPVEARDRAARVLERHPQAPLEDLIRRAVSGSARRRG